MLPVRAKPARNDHADNPDQPEPEMKARCLFHIGHQRTGLWTLDLGSLTKLLAVLVDELSLVVAAPGSGNVSVPRPGPRGRGGSTRNTCAPGAAQPARFLGA